MARYWVSRAREPINSGSQAHLGHPQTNIIMEEAITAHREKNWCGLVSTLVLSTGFCFFGLTLVLRGEGKTGLVLIISSGGLLALSLCAAMGKCKPEEEDKAPEDPSEDRPPTYRLSWRRSFLRRVKQRNSGDPERGGGGGRGESVATNNVPQDLNGEGMCVTCSTSDLLSGTCSSTVCASLRQTQSLSNLLDPPSYQDAVTQLDEASRRKLQSEMCLPTFP